MTTNKVPCACSLPGRPALLCGLEYAKLNGKERGPACGCVCHENATAEVSGNPFADKWEKVNALTRRCYATRFLLEACTDFFEHMSVFPLTRELPEEVTHMLDCNPRTRLYVVIVKFPGGVGHRGIKEIKETPLLH